MKMSSWNVPLRNAVSMSNWKMRSPSCTTIAKSVRTEVPLTTGANISY